MPRSRHTNFLDAYSITRELWAVEAATQTDVEIHLLVSLVMFCLLHDLYY